MIELTLEASNAQGRSVMQLAVCRTERLNKSHDWEVTPDPAITILLTSS